MFDAWIDQTLRLAAGVGSIDPGAGQEVLACVPEAVLDSPQHEFYGLAARALIDPATAERHLKNCPGYTAQAVRDILQRRSAVIDRLELLHHSGWVREGESR
jgi:hypothetical protein